MKPCTAQLLDACATAAIESFCKNRLTFRARRWAAEGSTLPKSLREGNPATLDAVWRDVADAVYRTDQGLLVALHVDRLLAIETKAA